MNNFDTSTSGENIEFYCCYDYDLSRMLYEEFEAENTRLNFGRDNTLFLIGEAEIPYYSKLDLEAKSKAVIFELCQQYDLLSYSVSLNDYKKADYINDLLNITIRQHYEYLIANYSWHGIGENILHDFYISRGYSQGDAIYIVKLEGGIDNNFRKYVDRILWDSPINIYANVSGLEFFEDEFLNDFYEWDADKVKEKIKGFSISDYAKSWIIEALPEYPEYR